MSPFDPERLFVLAPTAQAVQIFANDYGLNVQNLVYVNREAAVRGRRDILYVVLPGFWDRPDARDIWTAVQLTMHHSRDQEMLPLPTRFTQSETLNVKPKTWPTTLPVVFHDEEPEKTPDPPKKKRFNSIRGNNDL